MDSREADGLLLDALLEHLGGQQQAPLQRRTETVLRALHSPPPVRRRSWRGIVQLAAVFLLSLLVYGWWPPAQTAEAVLDRALEASQQSEDRRYLVEVVRASANRLRFELDVHGARRCVLRGQSFSLGLDGQQAWFVPLLGPVLVNPEPVLIEAWLERSGAPAPFLELTTVLRRLRERYQLELLPATEGPAAGRRLRGWAREPDELGPQRIELLADAQSGVVRELRLLWDAGRSPLGLRRIELSLSGFPDLPPDWYRHQAHHEPDRAVLVLNP